jgi:tetratricopeptide (TPR) repeat protein
MRNALVSFAILIVLAGAFYFLFFKPHTPAATQNPQGTASSTAATSTATAVVTPDYKKPIAFSDKITPEIRADLNKGLAVVQARIDKNKLDLEAWITLGTLYKMGDDYTGAAQAWQFVVDTFAASGPYYNLGDLYQNFFKDYPKAEGYYRNAIKYGPKNIQAYMSLYTLYHYQYKIGTGADKAILEEGLKNNPNDAQLLELQKEL